MSTRRQFILTAAGASAGFVTLLLVPVVGCGGSDAAAPAPATTTCNGVSSTSTVVDAHTHTICVPTTDLTSPPTAGVTYVSSVAAGHTHAVSLTQSQLGDIGYGRSVTVTSAPGAAGQTPHDFTITKV